MNLPSWRKELPNSVLQSDKNSAIFCLKRTRVHASHPTAPSAIAEDSYEAIRRSGLCQLTSFHYQRLILQHVAQHLKNSLYWSVSNIRHQDRLTLHRLPRPWGLEIAIRDRFLNPGSRYYRFRDPVSNEMSNINIHRSNSKWVKTAKILKLKLTAKVYCVKLIKQ